MESGNSNKRQQQKNLVFRSKFPKLCTNEVLYFVDDDRESWQADNQIFRKIYTDRRNFIKAASIIINGQISSWHKQHILNFSKNKTFRPNSQDIYDYLITLCMASDMDYETCICAISIFVQALQKLIAPIKQPRNRRNGKKRCTLKGWRYILLSSVILSGKLGDDLSMSNQDFCDIFGEQHVVTLDDINTAELIVYKLLDFNVFVSIKDYNTYSLLIEELLSTPVSQEDQGDLDLNVFIKEISTVIPSHTSNDHQVTDICRYTNADTDTRREGNFCTVVGVQSPPPSAPRAAHSPRSGADQDDQDNDQNPPPQYSLFIDLAWLGPSRSQHESGYGRTSANASLALDSPQPDNWEGEEEGEGEGTVMALELERRSGDGDGEGVFSVGLAVTDTSSSMQSWSTSYTSHIHIALQYMWSYISPNSSY